MGERPQRTAPCRLVGEGWEGACAAPDAGPDAGPDARAANALDAALLAAHAARDELALARLYACAADAAEARGETDAACFFLTQAYVFALCAGAAEADALHARLLAHGREE
jgi:hypothetical protein